MPFSVLGLLRSVLKTVSVLSVLVVLCLLRAVVDASTVLSVFSVLAVLCPLPADLTVSSILAILSICSIFSSLPDLGVVRSLLRAPLILIDFSVLSVLSVPSVLSVLSVKPSEDVSSTRRVLLLSVSVRGSLSVPDPSVDVKLA